MIEEIYARCPEMFNAARTRAGSDWFAAEEHTHERHKFTLFPSIEVLAKFRDYQIGGIGLEPIDHMLSDQTFSLFQKIQNPNYSQEKFKLGMVQYANASAEILKKLSGMSGIPKFSKNLFDIFVCNLVEVRSNGGLFGTIEANKREVLTSIFAARTAHRSAIAAELYLSENPAPPHAIMELGGGFGKSLADLVRIFPDAVAIYVDLPVNMAIAAHYFDGRFPGRVNLVWCETETVRPGMINVVAPWLIDKIDLQIDLMINFLSMHHMPQRTMDFYFARLIAPRVRFFYHENRLEPRAQNLGEGELRLSPKRAGMDVRHSIEIPWGVSEKATFSELICNPAVT